MLWFVGKLKAVTLLRDGRGRYALPSATVRAGDDIDVVQTPLGHLSPDFHDDYLHARDS